MDTTATRTLLVAGALALVGLGACSDDGGGSSLEDFCREARVADSLGDEIDALFDASDAAPADVEGKITEYLSVAADASDVAPEEVRPAFETVTEAQQQVADVLEENGWDLATAVSAPEFAELAADAEVEAAQGDLDGYLERECGIAADDEAAAEDTAVPDTAAADAGAGSDAPDPAAAAAETGAAFAGAFGVELDEQETACVGAGVLDSFSAARLIELAQPGAEPTDEEAVTALRAVESCVDPDKLAEGFAEQAFGTITELTAEQKSCLASGLLDEFGLAGLGEVGLTGEEPTAEYLTAFGRIAVACGIDPSLIATG